MADDLDEVAHCHVSVDQMETPVGLHLSVRDNVTDDLICARVGRIPMNGDGEIGAVLVRNAFCRQQSRHAHKWCIDRLWGSDPRTGFRRSAPRPGSGREISVKSAAASAERGGVRTGGDHLLVRHAPET